jgi:uncharacterized protein YunC (DUF1805 family)
MDLGLTVANVARAAAQKIYGTRPTNQLGKATVVYYTQAEAEILIKESIHLELTKLGLMK